MLTFFFCVVEFVFSETNYQRLKRTECSRNFLCRFPATSRLKIKGNLKRRNTCKTTSELGETNCVTSFIIAEPTSMFVGKQVYNVLSEKAVDFNKG